MEEHEHIPAHAEERLLGRDDERGRDKTKREEDRERAVCEAMAARSTVTLIDYRANCWYSLPSLPEPRVCHAMVVPMERAFWQ